MRRRILKADSRKAPQAARETTVPPLVRAEANTKHSRGPHDTLMHTLSTTPREAVKLRVRITMPPPLPQDQETRPGSARHSLLLALPPQPPHWTPPDTHPHQF